MAGRAPGERKSSAAVRRPWALLEPPATRFIVLRGLGVVLARPSLGGSAENASSTWVRVEGVGEGGGWRVRVEGEGEGEGEGESEG